MPVGPFFAAIRDATLKDFRECLGRVTRSVLLLVIALGACREQRRAAEYPGKPEAGAILLAAHGCGGCHIIPGVSGATGTIGPPLDGFARRLYIAGRLPNSFDALRSWIRAPQAIEPGTAMPNLPVNDAEARAMAAYLYTLR
jgi:cytochrome c1